MKTAHFGRSPYLCLSIVLGTLSARAEPVIAPAAPAPAAASEAQASTAKLGAKATLDSAYRSTVPLAKWGAVSLRPHFLYRLMYASNLLNPQQTEPASSVLQTYSPGTLFEVGDHWVLDYTFSRVLYSNRAFVDETQQDASATGAYRFDRWSFSTSGRYSSSSSPLVETSRQTSQKTYGGDVTVTTHVGDHINLTSEVNAFSRRVGKLPLDPQWNSADWESWTMSELLHYTVSPRLNLGVGITAGYDRITPGPDMEHTEPEASVTWRPSEKFTVTAKGGYENRRFKGGRNDSTRNPLYQASVEYAPLDTTKLVVGGSRTYSASYFANWATRGQSWNTGLQQRLLQHFFFSAEYSVNRTSYVYTNAGTPFNRLDSVRIINMRLSTGCLGRGSISVFFQNGRNLSNAPGFSYRGHEVGGEFAYRF